MSLSTAAKRVALVTGSGKKRLGWYVADALALPVGDVDAASDRATSALANYREALKLREQLSSAAESDLYLRRDLAEALLKVGDALMLTGDRAHAAETYDKATRILEALSRQVPANVDIRDLLAEARAGLK